MSRNVRLVNNTFPGDEQEVPLSTELSVLLYYAGSKPAKLSKIGSYLEGRLIHDLYRARYK